MILGGGRCSSGWGCGPDRPSPQVGRRTRRRTLTGNLLVFPASYAPGTAWRKIRGWWLAAEVFSPSSRVYDRAYKRDAYLSLGVRELWLVDLDDRAVFVSRRGEDGRDVRHARQLLWTPAESREPLAIDVASLFQGIP